MQILLQTCQLLNCLIGIKKSIPAWISDNCEHLFWVIRGRPNLHLDKRKSITCIIFIAHCVHKELGELGRRRLECMTLNLHRQVLSSGINTFALVWLCPGCERFMDFCFCLTCRDLRMLGYWKRISDESFLMSP